MDSKKLWPSEKHREELIVPTTSAQSAEEIRFESEPSSSLYCPICQDLFTKPVITPDCYHSFCRQCLSLSLSHEKNCPMCRCKVEEERLLPNLLIASIIGELRVSCRNKGCTWKGVFGDLREHENGTCAHRQVWCLHQISGCKWSGAFCELPAHVSICPFEVFKEYMKGVADEMSSLRGQIALLKVRLESLGERGNWIGSGEIQTSPRGTQITRRLSSEGESSKLLSEQRRANVERLECKRTLQHHTRNVTSLAICESGSPFFFSASHDKQICMWETEKGEIRHSFSGNKDSVWALAYSDGVLYSGSEGSLVAWNVPTGIISRQSNVSGESFKSFSGAFSGESSKTYTLIPSQRSSLLFSGNYKNIGIWDKNSREAVSTIKLAHDDCVWTLSFSSSTPHISNSSSSSSSSAAEDFLISGSDDGTVKVWDLRTISSSSDKPSTPLKVLEFHESKFLSVASGGGYIFGGTQSGQTQVWSATTFEHVTSLRGHQWDVWQLSYAGNGLLASGSYDHTIKIWDTNDMTCLTTLTGHRSNIYALKAEMLDHKKGDIRLFSGSGDKTIKIWEVPPEANRVSNQK